MPETDDERFLRLAIEASRAAADGGDMPFGASLVQSGALLQVSRNNQRTSGDCTGHAEVVLLREATVAHGPAAVRGSTVYASGEPCAMCSGALFWAGVTRVVFGATTGDIMRELGEPTLALRCSDVLAHASPSVQVDGPLLREAAVAVLRAFASKA